MQHAQAWSGGRVTCEEGRGDAIDDHDVWANSLDRADHPWRIEERKRERLLRERDELESSRVGARSFREAAMKQVSAGYLGRIAKRYQDR
jgi:hypothetical protein